MVPADVQNYVARLALNGLTHTRGDAAVDLVVVDQIRGFMTACDWAEFGETEWNGDPNVRVSACRAKPSKMTRLVALEGWVYSKSLSANHTFVHGGKIPSHLKFLRSEGGIDVLVDERTGQEFYVGRS